MTESKTPSNRQILLKYAGLTTQILVTLAVTVWLGWMIDRKWVSEKPVFTVGLPLLILVSLLVKIWRDTGRKK